MCVTISNPRQLIKIVYETSRYLVNKAEILESWTSFLEYITRNCRLSFKNSVFNAVD